jgi:hypothetical protein
MNTAKIEQERLDLLTKLLEERFGDTKLNVAEFTLSQK